jgi:GDSL-like Lipase/Acylhydrolase family
VDRDAVAFLGAYREAAIEKWEDDIQKLEKLDASETDPEDGILLIGSSSIRRWQSSAVDLAPYRTIRRGFGGSKYSDLAVYAERLIRPHQYRGVVMFVGNDVTGSKEDHTPDQVEELVRYIISVSRNHQPDSPIFIVEVTPTPKRLDAWPEIRKLNARLRETALTESNTYFVATAEHYLDNNDQPREKLFVNDRLHQNQDGYAIWAGLIRRRMDEVFRASAEADYVSPTEHETEP